MVPISTLIRNWILIVDIAVQNWDVWQVLLNYRGGVQAQLAG